MDGEIMDNNYYQVANFPVPGTVAVVMFLSIYRVQIRQLELLRILGYNTIVQYTQWFLFSSQGNQWLDYVLFAMNTNITLLKSDTGYPSNSYGVS